MATYQIALGAGVGPNGSDLLQVGFADPASNDVIVREAKTLMDDLAQMFRLGGELLLINGPASLPVACVLTHAVGHLYSAVGVFDPKLAGYVIAIAHGGRYAVGDVILA
jgi:CRISPR-associated protein Csx3